jgi:hypothetical protein
MGRSHRETLGTATLALALALAACGGGSEPAGPPASVTVLTPAALTGTVGIALAEPLQVRVADASGRAVPRVGVLFAVVDSAGSVGVDGSARALSFTDTTNADGVAEATWVLGTVAGTQAVSASVEGLAPVAIEAEALAGAAAAVFVADQSALAAPVSSPTDEPLAVVVTDAYLNPIAGTTVTWSVVTAGASVAAPTSVTDSAGIGTVGATLGATPGVYQFRGTVSGGITGTVGVLAVTIVTDPEGDAVPTQNPAFDTHDATRFGALVVSDVLVLYAKFAGVIGPVATTGPITRAALAGDYDLDLDGDSLTGYLSLRECLGGPPAGLGVDAFVDLNQRDLLGVPGVSGVPPEAIGVWHVDSLDSSDRCGAGFWGDILVTVPFYQPTSVVVAIPLTFLKDDGAFRITTLFAQPGTATVTDVVPDSLPWSFAPPPAVTATAAAGDASVWELLPIPRPTGRVIRSQRGTFRRRPPG